MTVTKTHALFNLDGSPKLDANPVFVLGPDGSRDFRSSVGARTPPPITRIRDNIYGFTPKETDEKAGTAYLIDGGPDCLERYHVGVVHQRARPIDAFFFIDSSGELWVGAAPPPPSTYSDVSGNVRTPPALQALSGSYLYLLTPTSADLSVGVTYVFDAPAGAQPPSWHGTLSAELALLSVTKAAVLERFPELDGEPALSELVWNELLLDVAMEIPVKAWLDQDAADRAALWLTAHMVALEKRRLNGGFSSTMQPGQLQSITVGPVTKTWAVAQSSEKGDEYMSDAVLEQTEYGREYMRLRKRFCRAAARR